MRNVLIALLLIVLLPVLWFLSQLFGWHLPNYKWSTRVTMTVSTPQGEISASNVLGSGATVIAGPKHLGYGYRLRGEATVLKLPPTAGYDQGKPRYLFLLLKDGFYYFLKQSFPKAIQKDHQWLNRVADLKGKAPIVVSRDAYPMLVTFDDVSKPETVKQVHSNILAATFGPGYALKSIAIEITDEPVTEGRVKMLLGWLNSVWPNQLDGRRFETVEADNRFANSLSTGNFSTEIGR